MTSRRLAERIAAVLFRDGSGRRATRLRLEFENGVTGGGWCQEAAADWIEKTIKEFSDSGTAPARARVAGGTKRKNAKPS